MRIEDIAKKLQLSPTTVSRVLNNSASVKPETRARVLAEIEETGFVPNMIAQGLRTRSRMIAVITQDILNPYYIEALYSIEKICRENGYAMTSMNSDNSEALERKNLIQLISMRVAGVVLLANINSRYDDIMRRYRDHGIQLITMEGVIEGEDCVLSDERHSVRQAMDYLYQMGHRKIGVCHGSMRSYPVVARMNAMKAHLEYLGCPFDEAYQYLGHDFIEQLECARQEERLPTALFTLNDNTAIAVYRWCKSVSLRIPEDLSILGFDDVSLADILSPPLTTIAQPIGYLAETAINHLISRMQSSEIRYTSKIMIPTELVLRDSVANI